MQIKKILGIEIFDSRGNPTLAATVILENGITGEASVPSGASTGVHEAVELRDGDPKRYNGKGVLNAIKNIEGPLQSALIGMDVREQETIDRRMIELDGTDNKGKFGANAILGISLAVARAHAALEKKELYEILGPGRMLPIPMINIINGGAHANNGIEIQEFMIRPIGLKSFEDKIRAGSEIFHALQKILATNGLSTSVGDEGGFAPPLKSNEEALSWIMKAIERAGYRPQEDVTLALDCAASSFFWDGYYVMKGKRRTAEEQIAYYAELAKQYPIDSIEDGLDEDDWDGCRECTRTLGNNIQIVGDDLFVTNPKFLERGIKNQVANAILIKLNQVGTLTETLETIKLAQTNQYKTIASHRSGETEDTFIADLAVATNAGQIKTGSICRGERTAKYNRLLKISSQQPS